MYDIDSTRIQHIARYIAQANTNAQMGGCPYIHSATINNDIDTIATGAKEYCRKI